MSRELSASQSPPDGSGWPRRAADRGPEAIIYADGVAVTAYEGEAVGVALAVAGRLTLRLSPVEAMPRGMFCAMGTCQECAVEIDGDMRAACMTPVRHGMRVTTDALSRRLATAANSSDG